jgi:hypothetical protein
MSEQSTRKRRQSIDSTTRNMIIIVVAVVVGIGALILLALGSGTTEINVNVADIPDESVTVAFQGQNHIEVGAAHEPYNSNPPTSGPHYASPARAGMYEQILPDENVVHNLEHGHVWLSYRDAGDSEAIDLLRRLQASEPLWVIVTHRPDNDTRVAAAAWTRLLTLDDLDQDQLAAFVERHHNNAPESIPG